MKKILYISALFCAITLSGCDSLLDVSPGSELTDDGFWKSETDLKGACNKLYYDLSEPKWSADARSDEFVQSSSNGTSNGSRTVPGTSDDWTKPYGSIFTANNIIEKGETAPLAEDVRNRWKAEAFFFRAYHHFELVKKYGDVPLVTKTHTSVYDEELKMGRTPREVVIQQCYEDLEFAVANLPAHSALPTGELDRRRVSRSSALGMMVRIGLYEGTFQKYHGVNGGSDANAHFDKAINAFERLKAEGVHSLFADYNDVFSYLNEANSTNPEIVFGVAFGENDFSTVSTGHVHTRDLEGSFAFTRNVLDLFLYADGLPIHKTSLKIPVETSYNNIVGRDGDGNPLPDGLGQRDPRLLKSIWIINDELENDDFIGWIKSGKGEYFPFDSQRPKGYPCKKAFFGSQWEQSSGNKDFTDRILIRYAEMLISYAEALYERNGTISDGQLDETVNKLRERVGFDKRLTNAFASEHGLDMLEEIRRERTVELLGEDFRYDDIIRWKIAEKVLPTDLIGPICLADELQNPSLHGDMAGRLTDNSGYLEGVYVYDQPGTYVIEFKNSRRFDPNKDYLYPIPTFEIAQSDFNIVQNPGWGQ